MPIPPLTQSIGSAERSMRALLERNLREADLSFSAWTALVFTNSSPLTSEQVAQRQISGHVVASTDEAQQEINKIIQAGLIKMNESGVLMHTDKGAAIFQQISGKVKEIAQSLYGDLPLSDLETTHRTLLEIANRANGLLSSSK